MKKQIVFGLALLILSGSLQARDHVPVAAGSSHRLLQNNVEDDTLISASKQYPHSLEGLRQYLNQEVTEGDRDYERLDQRLKNLERQEEIANRAALVPIGLGIGCMLVGGVMRQDQEPTDPLQKSIHEKGGQLLIYGLAGVAGGFLLGEILSPGEKDIQGFINFHNGETPLAKKKDTDLSLKFLSGNQLVSLQYSF